MKHLKLVLSAAALASASAFAAAPGAAPGVVTTTVNSDIVVDTTWASGSTILLDGPIFVRDGAVLTIEPGVIVRGQPRTAASQIGSIVGAPGSLIVTQSGKIFADGTDAQPIIFTTAAVDNNTDGIPDDDDMDGFNDPWTAGDIFYDDDPIGAPLAPLDTAGNANVSLWGGVVVNGSAPVNVNVDINNDNFISSSIMFDPDGAGPLPIQQFSEVGVGLVEGLVIPGVSIQNALYGGKEAGDCSGSLSFISIRHGGDEIGTANEINGLTLAGVGYNTRVENIEIYANFDDGIEWFGGTVEGCNYMIAYIGDDSLDVDQGYTGFNQFAFVVKPFFKQANNAEFGSVSGDSTGEWDGDDYDEGISNPTVKAETGITVAIRAVGTILDDLVSPLEDLVELCPCPFSNPTFANLTSLGADPEQAGAGDVLGTTPVNFAPADFAALPNGVTARDGGNGIRMRHGFGGRLLNSIIENTDRAIRIQSEGDAFPGFEVQNNVANGLIVIATTTVDDYVRLDDAGLACQAFANGDALFGDPAFALFPTFDPGRNQGYDCVNGVRAMVAGDLLLNDDTSFNPTGNANGKLDSTLQPVNGPINPRAVSAFIGETNTVATVITAKGGEVVLYRGAFEFDTSVDDLWTTGWTVLNLAGMLVD